MTLCEKKSSKENITNFFDILKFNLQLELTYTITGITYLILEESNGGK